MEFRPASIRNATAQHNANRVYEYLPVTHVHQISVTTCFTTPGGTRRITIHEDTVSAYPLYSVVAAWRVLSSESTLDAVAVLRLLPVDRRIVMTVTVISGLDTSGR